MSVRLSKFPNELQCMLSYVEQTCEAARDHTGASGWREYDEKLWCIYLLFIDGQLWLSIFTRPLNTGIGPQNSIASSSVENNKPMVDICNFFNKSNECLRKDCSYSHVCSNCMSTSHGALNCNKNTQKAPDS